MKVCQVGDESLSGIYLLFIQCNRARAKKRIFKFLSNEN